MNFVQDDATELSAFSSGMISACIDKGLMDAIYCADEYEQCGQVLSSVHRVLKPGGVFCVLSFSRPQFFLKNIWMPPNARNRAPARVPVWESVQIQELDTIMLYRFEKSREEATSGPLRLRNNKKPKRQRRSN
jgi:ubiquinone/menaquinone biosynthesis C-methylase UbiE